MSMFRFLPGIIIAQGATAVLVLAIVRTAGGNWLLLAPLALIASFLTAFWFASIANHMRKDALARQKEESARERERLRVSTEKEKNRVLERTQKQITKEAGRANGKANFKVGAAVVGTAAVGVGLLSLQFLTLGLLPLFAAAGGVAGYGVRVRHEAKLKKTDSAQSIFPRSQPKKPVSGKNSIRPSSPRKASR